MPSTSDVSHLACHACGVSDSERIHGFERISLVTSDCKPWAPGAHLTRCHACGLLQKSVDAHWSDDVARIYGDYAIYEQSGGAEQVIFIAGPEHPIPRSAHVVEELRRRTLIPPTGRLLDIGCGNGALLRAFASAAPGWSMAGTELDDRHRAKIEAIKGVEQLHVGPVSTLAGPFDIVTMMHVLEHVVSPHGVLADIRDRLDPSGILVINVPNYLENPFDLVVADHASHFEPATLVTLLYRAGFEIELLSDAIPKEMVAVAKPVAARTSRPSEPRLRSGPDPASLRLLWLHAVKDEFAFHAQRRPVGIFGSSIAASWTFGALDREIDFFVDEDPHRADRRHLGRPIITPTAVPEGSRVLVPIAPALAPPIAHSRERPGVTYCLPPSLPTETGHRFPP
jgi:SAM-dependent methyltransferase